MPGKRARLLRRKLQEKTTLPAPDVCAFCWRSLDPARGGKWIHTVDHILPRARGGTNHRRNLRPLCFGCHAVLNDAGQCVGALACMLSINPRARTKRRTLRRHPDGDGPKAGPVHAEYPIGRRFAWLDD